MTIRTLMQERGPTLPQVMAYLGLTRSQLRYRLRRGLLHATKRGQQFEFDAAEVDAYKKKPPVIRGRGRSRSA